MHEGRASAARDGLFGASPAITELRRYLSKVAMSDATVLVTGETGTGKERVASAVHRLGRRATKPFVAVNCAAIPEALIESELFGHRRGAFTGAVDDFPGRFAQADGGTLFLDEIGEMSPSGQVKLLRVLEEGTVTPVGGARPRPIDVRLVAASNQRLEQMVETREFRADLFYRLNVARIELPPLRARPEDIGLIAGHFIEEHNRRRAMRVGRPDAPLAGANATLFLARERARAAQHGRGAVHRPARRPQRLDRRPAALVQAAVQRATLARPSPSANGWSRCCGKRIGTRWRPRAR